MTVSQRFKKLADKYGFKITHVLNRNDILSVKFKNRHIFTIPRKMYLHYMEFYRDLGGRTHPNFFQCLNQLRTAEIECKKVDKLKEVEEFERINHINNYA